MIAAEQGAPIGKAQMVGSVARGRDGRHGLAVDIDRLCIVEHAIRHIIAIERGIGTRPMFSAAWACGLCLTRHRQEGP